MQYIIENKKVIKSNSWQKEFSCDVKQIIEFETTVVVLIDFDSKTNLIKKRFRN